MMPSDMVSAGRQPESTLPAGYGGAEGLERRLASLLARGGSLETIGSSRQGRPIRVYLRRSEPPPGPVEAAGRPSPAPAERILLLSLLHPMEWIGLEAHLALLESWFSPGGGRATGVLPNGTHVASLAVAHPDGFARVEESLRAGRARWVRANLAGVDLNRNFPVGHRPRPRLLEWWPAYRPGPAPLSEPETAALAALAREFRPTLALSLHSFGRWIFVPPAAGRSPRPSTAGLLDRARHAAAGSGYRAAALGRWSPLFRARGTEIDFLHEEIGAHPFLVEISRGGFGRWGARRLLEPFTFFNPPDPETEIARVLPVLRRLIEG